MQSFSLLATRSRLFRSAKRAHCACLAAHSVDFNLIHLRPSKSRYCSNTNGPKDVSDEAKHDKKTGNQPRTDDINPLERLMKYSQQFQLDLDSLSDNNGHDDRAADAMPGSSWKKESTSNNGRNQSSWNDSMTNAFDSQKKSVNHSILGKMAVDRILEKDFDEIDYDTELEAVWDEEQVKQRKFYQALRRDLDRDFVCTNCGERGHRARNCLVPQICSNCGNLGHRHDQCKFKRSPETIDEFLRQEEEKRKKSRKMRKKAARAVKNPGLPRPKDLPTSDFHKRNDCLRKELDAELKAYADKLEKQAQKRRELKAQKEQEQI